MVPALPTTWRGRELLLYSGLGLESLKGRDLLAPAVGHGRELLLLQFDGPELDSSAFLKNFLTILFFFLGI